MGLRAGGLPQGPSAKVGTRVVGARGLNSNVQPKLGETRVQRPSLQTGFVKLQHPGKEIFLTDVLILSLEDRK